MVMRWNNIHSYMYIYIYISVVVNFNQSSYEVTEGRKLVAITIELSRPSSKLFQVIISSMNITIIN